MILYIWDSVLAWELLGWLGVLGKGAYWHRDFGRETWIAFGVGLGIIILTLGGRCMIGPDHVNKRALDMTSKCFVDVHALL